MCLDFEINMKSIIGEPLLVQKRTATSSNSRPNTSTSATFDQGDQTSDETSTDENASPQNRNERSPVNIFPKEEEADPDESRWIPSDSGISGSAFFSLIFPLYQPFKL